MSNINLLILSFLIPISILIVFRYWLFRKKQNDAEVFDKHWSNFKKTIKLKDVKGICTYGDLVLWNSNLTYQNLVYMATELDNITAKNKQLVQLKGHVFNKKLSIERSSNQFKF